MRILIADNWPNVQNALRVLLEQQPGLDIVGEVVRAGELLAKIEDNCPDTLLLGWELPGLRGGDLLPALRLACPHMLVIALSGRPNARRAALAAGADAFVSKVAPPEELLSAILALGQAEGGAQHFLNGRLGEHQHRSARMAAPADVVEGSPDRGTVDDVSTYSRRTTMVEENKKRRDMLRYVAAIAVAAVLLGCIAAGLTVSLVLISEIPFHTIFGH